MEEKIITGLPTLSLLPLTETKFKVIDQIKIILQRKGKYNNIAPKIFGEDTGSFDILANNILYLPSITKVLLAAGKYPILEQNQVFTPLSFEFEDNEVIINGSILEIVSISEVSDGNKRN